MRSENVEKAFPVHVQQLPSAPHIKTGATEQNQFQRQSYSRSNGYIVPTTFTDCVLRTVGVQRCGCGMRGIVTGVYLDQSNTEVHRKKSHHLSNGTESATRASNQKIRLLKTLVAAGTSGRSFFIEELDQPGLSHARSCNFGTVARLNHLQMLVTLFTALTADKNQALITLFKALTAASHAAVQPVHMVSRVFFSVNILHGGAVVREPASVSMRKRTFFRLAAAREPGFVLRYGNRTKCVQKKPKGRA